MFGGNWRSTDVSMAAGDGTTQKTNAMNDGGDARAQQVSIFRYLKANALTGIVALAWWMAMDAIYVWFGKGRTLVLDGLSVIVVVVAALLFLRANWRIASGPVIHRLMKAALLSLPAFSCWFFFSAMVLLWFHPFIGGYE